MANKNLTATLIKNSKCPEGKKQVFIWDAQSPGLGVRITPSAKVYIFQGRLGKKKVRIKIGDTKTCVIGHARDQALELKQLMRNGIDPRVEKKNRIAKGEAELEDEKKKDLTVLIAWDQYLEIRKPKWSERHYNDHVNLSQVGGKDRKRSKLKTKAGVLASLMPLKMTALTKKQVTQWAETESQVRAGQTRLAFSLLRAFLNWCADQDDFKGMCSHDVCSSSIKKEVIKKQTPKKDCLQREQLKAWFAAVSSYQNKTISVYLQTLLLIGSRREELTHLKWEDVDFKWQGITIHDKVEESRVIPLTPYVASLLNGLPRKNKWVFSSPSSKSGRLMTAGRAHRKALDVAGIEDLTLHGLRRSFGTLSEWVEVPVGIVAQLMGHKPSAIAEKHYRQRPLDLLRKWHVKIEEWILEEAGIEFNPEENELGKPNLKLVNGTK